MYKAGCYKTNHRAFLKPAVITGCSRLFEKKKVKRFATLNKIPVVCGQNSPPAAPADIRLTQIEFALSLILTCLLALLAASIAITDKDLAPVFTEAASWTNLLFFGAALFYLASLIFFAGGSVGKWGIALAFLICSFAVTGPISYVEGWEREEQSPFVAQTKRWLDETQSAISNLDKETRLREKRAEEYDACARQRDGMRIFAQLLRDSKIIGSGSSAQAEVEGFCGFESRRYNDQRQSELSALNVLRSLDQARPTR